MFLVKDVPIVCWSYQIFLVGDVPIVCARASGIFSVGNILIVRCLIQASATYISPNISFVNTNYDL